MADADSFEPKGSCSLFSEIVGIKNTLAVDCY